MSGHGRRELKAYLGLPGLACLACTGVPTPLAPGLAGSVGVPHQGVLTDGVELPAQGPGFVRYRPKGSFYWGNTRLVTAISEISASMAEEDPAGAALVVGDLSARTGGKIPRHNSHRTGRDVDFLYFLTTPEGAPVRSPGFIRIDSDGFAEHAGKLYRLDVPRQWRLIKKFLQSPRIEVQWLFVSRDIEALVIDYALARETDLELIWQAETVMLEPTDSAPHDDHVHMRIACTELEAVYGCEGGGPRWQWQPALPELPALPSGFAEQLLAEDPFPGVASL